MNTTLFNIKITYSYKAIILNISEKTPCPKGVSSTPEDNTQPVCYDLGLENKQLMRCSNECLGGCHTKGDNNKELKLIETQDECYSCRNYLSPLKGKQFSPSGNHVCWSEVPGAQRPCGTGFVSVSIFLF